MIRKNIKLEARLIDDLLDITGIAQGKLRFHFRNLDLRPLLKESIEALRSDIDKKEIQITLDLSVPELMFWRIPYGFSRSSAISWATP